MTTTLPFPTFVFGNARITIVQDFDAIGRYVVASEQARNFAHERDLLLGQLQHQIQMTLGTKTGNIAVAFDMAKAEDILKRVKDLNRNLAIAVQEANLQADACDRPKLELWSLT